MGNRAVIQVEGSKVGVYLHWNGGESSVEAFLRAARDLNIRHPVADTSYFYARFVQMVGNFFGGTTSVGIDSIDRLDMDNGDNGVYVIDGNLAIIRRKYSSEAQPVDPVSAQEIYEEVMRLNQPIFNRE